MVRMDLAIGTMCFLFPFSVLAVHGLLVKGINCLLRDDSFSLVSLPAIKIHRKLHISNTTQSTPAVRHT